MDVTINKQPSVLVGMSGGVDSSATAALLMEQGYAVTGITLKLCPNAEGGDAKDAAQACNRLGIPHEVYDLRNAFHKAVITPFIHEYLAGRTPNPCIECNRYIKFGEMLKIADLLGIEKIATGHYARIRLQNGRYLLLKAADLSKDQSYVLYTLNQAQLKRTLMPLGEMTKDEARALAENHGFVSAHKKDSQDICFVPDGDYVGFLSHALETEFTKGPFVDLSGNIIGSHAGMIRYTIGQRKGLGMGFGKPMYVVSKDAAANRVVLGDESDLYTKTVVVKDLNWIAFDRLEAPLACKGKLRYRHTEQPCRLIPLSEDTILAEFDQPQRAVTAGQAAVFYDGDIVLGGGTITVE